MSDERFSRQRDLVNLAALEGKTVSIIGVGAVGRQVAVQLATMGVPHIQLIDNDYVEEANLGAQGFLESDLGREKVGAVGNFLRQLNSKIIVDECCQLYSRAMPIGEFVFCCVDRIETRKFISEYLLRPGIRPDLFVDGRMSGETLRIITVSDHKTARLYNGTLFESNRAFAGSCTAKTTIYTSNVIAGIMVGQLTKKLRGLSLRFDLTYDFVEQTIDHDLEGGLSNET